jgi:ketohexokinase
MAKILGIGNALIDQITQIATYPKEDSELRCLGMYEALGGNTINTLSVLRQLNHETAWSGTYAKDDAGIKLLKMLDLAQIDYQQAQLVRGGKTPISSIWLAEDTGSRTIAHFRDLAELDFEHFAKIEIENFDWLHFEARNSEAVNAMLNLAKCFLTTQPISLEIEKDRPLLAQLMTQVNVLFFSRSYAQQQGYSDAITFLTAMHKLAPNAQLFCGWGSDGAYAMDNKGESHFVAATQNIKVVDTIGAGDTFNAGVIDGLIRGHSTAEALKLGVELAERKIQQKGLNKLFANDNKMHLTNIAQLNAYKGNIFHVEGKAESLILVKYQNTARAYVNNCPHANVPLDNMYKVEIDPRTLTMKCSVHDAFFRVEDGFCVSGPCQNQALKAVPIIIDDLGNIFLA